MGLAVVSRIPNSVLPTGFLPSKRTTENVPGAAPGAKVRFDVIKHLEKDGVENVSPTPVIPSVYPPVAKSRPELSLQPTTDTDTSAEDGSLPPVGCTTEGLTLMGTPGGLAPAGWTVTVAEADWFESATLVAVTATALGTGTAAGAVYSPAGEIVPTLTFPPGTWLTLQVTAPEAVNCCVAPITTP